MSASKQILVTAAAGLLAVLLGNAQVVDAETAGFLKQNAPRLLQIIKEAEQQGYDEVLREATERVEELEEEWEEAKGDGIPWAKLMVGNLANESALEFLLWKFEEKKIGEGDAENELRSLMEERLEIRNGIARQEIAWMEKEGEEDEAAERAEELEWRVKNPRRAVNEMIRKFIEEELEGGEEDEDEDENQDELEAAGEVYTPPPAGKAKKEDPLAGVSFDYDTHIVPLLETYCFDCHDAESAKGDIDLESALAETPLVRNRLLWENVAERIKNEDMPPAKKPQPKAEDRLRMRALLANEIEHFDYSVVRNPGYLPARRLTREEYNRTIRDLVGLDLRPADQFPMDFSGTSGFSNSANTLFLATAHLDRYLTAAEHVIDSAREDPAAWARLAGGAPAEAIARFVRRAYRRSPSDHELAEVQSRFRVAKENGRSDSEALAESFKFVLVSPHFLLRVEEAGEEGVDQAVADFDLAARLSYFLWASTPDEELLAAAGRGDLGDLAKRRAQVDRMLTDPRSRALGDIFAGEWLGTDDVGPRIRKDPIDNPWCTESLMAAMRNETALFVHSAVVENTPVARLIDADFTYLNEELARFYGIPGVKGDAMRRVALDAEHRRGGLFGHASVLAATSYPDRTSPVVRGTWILTTLLGTPPPPPPPDVPEIEVEGRSRKAVRTLREKLERHRESKRCAGCHAQIDPLGFALENYAEFGQWRGGVDNRGTLPSGATFRGPAGLKLAVLDARLDDLGTQVIRKMLAYGLGRQLEYYDEAVVREIAAKLKPAGYPLGEMVREIADSYPFTTKRAPANPPSRHTGKTQQ